MALPVATISSLAWRNLWRNYPRTLIMLLAIAIGVWAMIFMSALMRGMTDEMVRNGLAGRKVHQVTDTLRLHRGVSLSDAPPGQLSGSKRTGVNLSASDNSVQLT